MTSPVRGHLQHLSVTHDVFVSQLSAPRDADFLGWFPTLGAEPLHFLHHGVAGNDISKHDVFPVQPVSLGGRDEELTSVGAGTAIGHRQHSWACVGQLEVLVSKLNKK